MTSWSVSPSLPAGLSLDSSTGAISGTPTAITSSASYTITASNTGGSTTASITIEVNDVAPSAAQRVPAQLRGFPMAMGAPVRSSGDLWGLSKG